MNSMTQTIAIFFIFSLIFAWLNYRHRVQQGLPSYMPATLAAQAYLLFFLIALARYCVIR